MTFFAFWVITFAFSFSNIYHQHDLTQNDNADPMGKIEQSSYSRTGAMKAKPGASNELTDLLLQAAELVSTSAGCRLYVVGKDINDEDIIWVTEIWDNQKDHARSLQLEEVRNLISKAMPLIDEFTEGGFEMNIVGGWGVD